MTVANIVITILLSALTAFIVTKTMTIYIMRIVTDFVTDITKESAKKAIEIIEECKH